MSRFYVACELGLTEGRVFLGTIHRDELTLSEVRRFPNEPIVQDESLHWNVPQLYHEIIEALRSVGAYEEPISSLSCLSWGGDYLLFGENGSLLTPAFHHGDERTEAGMKKVQEHISWETLYAETGMQRDRQNSICQLAAETSRRLKTVTHLLPIADGFNFLLSSIPRVELSLASATQLFNPVTQNWSTPVLEALKLPARILPGVVPVGTKLGSLRPDLAKETKIEGEVLVLAACSHELAASVASLPVNPGQNWAFMRAGNSTLMGTEVPKPVIHEISRELGFNNIAAYGGGAVFYKRTTGLWLLEQCQRFWQATDRSLDWDLLVHLAGSATPFESLINPSDPRFLVPGDMPLKIQAFCRETDQPVPRKPGAVFRCILESLALLHRRTLGELEYQAGIKSECLFLIGNGADSLFHHFIANALGVPVVVSHADPAALGNVIVQAVTLGHVKTLEEGREMIRRSLRFNTIVPQSTAWEEAFNRFMELAPSDRLRAEHPEATADQPAS